MRWVAADTGGAKKAQWNGQHDKKGGGTRNEDVWAAVEGVKVEDNKHFPATPSTLASLQLPHCI